MSRRRRSELVIPMPKGSSNSLIVRFTAELNVALILSRSRPTGALRSPQDSSMANLRISQELCGRPEPTDRAEQTIERNRRKNCNAIFTAEAVRGYSCRLT